MSDTSSGPGQVAAPPPPSPQTSNNHQNKDQWLKKRLSKSRLSKQDEVEEVDGTDCGGGEQQDTSPNSEESDSTVVAAAAATNMYGHSSEYTEVLYKTPYPSLDPERADPEGITLEQHQNGGGVMLGLAMGAGSDTTTHPPLEAQLSTDSNKGGSLKTKLKRTNAVNLDDQLDTALPQHDYLQVSPISQHPHAGKLSKDSSMGSENGSASGLSRDSSFDTPNYTDSQGVDLEHFIEKTLNKNQKDRMMLLRLEQDMDNFIRDEKHQFLRFPAMTSYHRMLVHRIAAFFGLDHNVDQSGKSVVVNRTPNTRIPDFKFQDHIQGDLEDMPKKILKKDRDASSLDDGHIRYMDPKKSRSFEERKENYEEARKRIFKSQESEGQMPEYIKESLGSNVSILKPGPAWSSTDSSGYSTDNSRQGHAPRAYSFGGTPSNLSRDNSRASTLSSGSRMSKADSQSSGISDLKTGSTLVRHPTIPSSPPPEISEPERSASSISSPLLHDGSFVPLFMEQGGKPMAVWVCTDLDSIPPGSVLINHNTGQPYVHPDGSVLRWPPPKPPPQSPSTAPPHSQTEHKYAQDQAIELQQPLSQLSLTSPQAGSLTMEPPGIPGEAPQPSNPHHQAGGQAMVGQPAMLQQNYTQVPAGSQTAGTPAGQVGNQNMAAATGGVAQYTPQALPQHQGTYFAAQPACSSGAVRYIYNQGAPVQYSSPTGNGVVMPPTSQSPPEPGQHLPGVMHGGQISMQTTGPQQPPPTQEGQYPTVYNYPTFQQMTVQSVDYMPPPAAQGTFQPPPNAGGNGGGGYQATQPGPQQSAEVNNTGNSQQGAGGGYSSQVVCSLSNSGGSLCSSSQGLAYNNNTSAQQQQQQPIQQQQTCYPVQYYSTTSSSTLCAGSGTQQVLAYQHTPPTGGQAYQPPQQPSQVSYRPKTPPPTSQTSQINTNSQQPQLFVSGNSYPVATVSAASAGGPHYVSYATYPPAAAIQAPPPPIGGAIQPAQRMLSHHHPPQMIALTPGGQALPAAGQQLTMVRPAMGVHHQMARSTPPPQHQQTGPHPQLQYPTAAAILPANPTQVKVITLPHAHHPHHHQLSKEPMPQETAGGIVNEKGDASANGYAVAAPQGGGIHQVSFVGPPSAVRGFVPQMITTPIRHQNPAAFRTASPVLQPLQSGQPYPRIVQQPLYTNRPRMAPPSTQSGGHQTKSGRNRRMAAIKHSQESIESNASSTDSMDQPTDSLPAASLLEVTGLPGTLKCSELTQHLADLTQAGGAIYVQQMSEDSRSSTSPSGGGNTGGSCCPAAADLEDTPLAEVCGVLVGFSTDSEAQHAFTELRSNSGYALQTLQRPIDHRTLCQL